MTETPGASINPASTEALSPANESVADHDPTGGWQVGDPALFRHRLGFDATFLRGTVVAVRIDDTGDQPVARFTVQIDPVDGAGRLQLDLAHLNRPTEPH